MDSPSKRTINDYAMTKKLGNGAFGEVFEAIDLQTREKVAVKSVNKNYIIKINKKRHVMREKNILNSMDHEFVIKLLSTC
jgi:serine/threonine protein kinase